MKNVVQDLTSAGIDWQREKWQSGLGSKFMECSTDSDSLRCRIKRMGRWKELVGRCDILRMDDVFYCWLFHIKQIFSFSHRTLQKHVRWNFNPKTAGKKLQGPQTTCYTAVWYLLTPIKSIPRSPLKAARSRTEESTWAGQTPRRRPLGPRLSEDW